MRELSLKGHHLGRTLLTHHLLLHHHLRRHLTWTHWHSLTVRLGHLSWVLRSWHSKHGSLSKHGWHVSLHGSFVAWLLHGSASLVSRLLALLGAETLKTWLQQLDQLLEDCVNVGLTHQLADVCVLLLVVLEVGLIVHLFELHLSDFLDFVEIDIKHLSVEILLVAVVLGILSFFRLLEAHESICSLSFFGEKLDAFDFSEFLEVGLQFISGCLRREVLHVQVASLL